MAKSTPAEVAEFVNAPIVVRYFGEIDNDADAAIVQAKRLLSNSALGFCNSSTLSQYKSVLKDTDTSYDDFNDELNLCINEKSDTLDDIQSAYEQLMYTLDLLEQANVVFKAVADAKLGIQVTAFVNVLGQVVGYGGTFKKKQSELATILKDLAKAKNKVIGSAAKMSFNAAITAGSLLAGPLGLGARISIAVAPQVVGLAIDAATDKAKPPTALKATYDAGSAAIDVGDLLNKKDAKMFGAFTAVLNTALDVSETAEAVKLKKDLDKKLTSFLKEYKKAKTDYLKQTKDLVGAMADAKKAFDTTVKDANKFSSKLAKRRAMMGQF